jgi:cbb3-type cytochrome oxidase maturation protein
VVQHRKNIFEVYNTPCMSVLIVLVIASVLVAGGFLAAFIWSVKKGQYDDDYAPSVRILFDDTVSSEHTNTN